MVSLPSKGVMYFDGLYLRELRLAASLSRHRLSGDTRLINAQSLIQYKIAGPGIEE